MMKCQTRHGLCGNTPSWRIVLGHCPDEIFVCDAHAVKFFRNHPNEVETGFCPLCLQLYTGFVFTRAERFATIL